MISPEHCLVFISVQSLGRINQVLSFPSLFNACNSCLNFHPFFFSRPINSGFPCLGTRRRMSERHQKPHAPFWSSTFSQSAPSQHPSALQNQLDWHIKGSPQTLEWKTLFEFKQNVHTTLMCHSLMCQRISCCFVPMDLHVYILHQTVHEVTRAPGKIELGGAHGHVCTHFYSLLKL